jgi:3-methyladenine DNA glycosylase AlkD
MKLAEAMEALRAAGTAQTRKTYAKQGIEEPMFGVLGGTLHKMAKKIKIDQPLAEGLWETHNHDARVLAMLIADPEKLGLEGLDSWAHQIANSGEACALVELVERSPWHQALADRWSEMSGEWVGHTGYVLVTSLAKNNKDIENSYFKRKLQQIENTVHQRENMCRYSMNNALIAIGQRNFELWEFAKMAYQRIGKIKVDHGETGAKTPDPKAELKSKPAE